MAKKNKFTEEELAAAAEKYFQSRGWTTYPEVVIPHFGGRADIVGGSSSNNLGSVLFLFGAEAMRRVLMSGLPGHLVAVRHYKARVNRK